MKNYKVEIRAGIAIVTGLAMMGLAKLIGAPSEGAVGAGIGAFVLVGVAFLFVGAFESD